MVVTDVQPQEQTMEAAVMPALSFARLWEAHPAVRRDLSPCAARDGTPNFENQCAIRMPTHSGASGRVKRCSAARTASWAAMAVGCPTR